MTMSMIEKKQNEYLNWVHKDGKGTAYKPDTNFMELPTNIKINICDDIMSTVKGVFGPYGGSYIAGKRDSHNLKDFSKSRDGQQFLSNLAFSTNFEQSILEIIFNGATYIAGYNDSTSRDGTTSCAMHSASIAKSHLVSLLDNKYNIPSTILTRMVNCILDVGSNMIKNDACLVFDKATLKYNKHGQELVKRTIATTCNGNNVVIDPFVNLIKEMEKSPFDIENAFIYPITKKIGGTKCELGVSRGFRLSASEVTAKSFDLFKDNKTQLYILDGYIDDYQMEIFKYLFNTFIHQLAHLKDEKGYYIYKNGKMETEGFDSPLFIINRKSNLMEEYYEKLQIEGVEIQRAGEPTPFLFKPRFLFVNSVTEGDKLIYNELLEMMPTSVVNFTGIFHILKKIEKKDTIVSGSYTNMSNYEIPKDETTKKPLFDFSDFFPKLNRDGKGNLHITKINSNKMSKGGNEFEYTYNLSNYVGSMDELNCIVGYNGTKVSILPLDNNVYGRLDEIVNKYKDKEKYVDSPLFVNGAYEAMLTALTSVALKPTIYVMSDDEFVMLKDQFEDALGVFQSVHRDGIMPGGNTYIIKMANKFKSEAINSIMEELKTNVFSQISNVENNNMYKLYIAYANTLIDDIIVGYETVYGILVNDYKLANSIINNHYRNPNKETGGTSLFGTYNILTGLINNYGVLESSRTTLDIFKNSIKFMFDLVTVSRIMIIDPHREANMIKSAEANLTYNSYMNITTKKPVINKSVNDKTTEEPVKEIIVKKSDVASPKVEHKIAQVSTARLIKGKNMNINNKKPMEITTEVKVPSLPENVEKALKSSSELTNDSAIIAGIKPVDKTSVSKKDGKSVITFD